jgi:hypothetical protein
LGLILSTVPFMFLMGEKLKLLTVSGAVNRKSQTWYNIFIGLMSVICLPWCIFASNGNFGGDESPSMKLIVAINKITYPVYFVCIVSSEYYINYILALMVSRSATMDIENTFKRKSVFQNLAQFIYDFREVIHPPKKPAEGEEESVIRRYNRKKEYLIVLRFIGLGSLADLVFIGFMIASILYNSSPLQQMKATGSVFSIMSTIGIMVHIMTASKFLQMLTEMHKRISSESKMTSIKTSQIHESKPSS